MRQTLINRFNFVLKHISDRFFARKYRNLYKIKHLNSIDTINLIIQERKSLSRFGDGEITLMHGKNTDFQTNNQTISTKLKKILANDDKDFLVGIPSVWFNPWGLKYTAIEFWASFLNRNLEGNILPYLNPDSVYCDSFISRFYMDYRHSIRAKKVCKFLRQIWMNRDICVIEGEYSALGIGNDLFDNANSIKRIICPSKNAFRVYEEIIAQAKELHTDTLILLALGMSATCLAYDLYKLGYQAVDIGHVDIEYEWFNMKAKTKCPIPGKSVAECSQSIPSNIINTPLYNSQIIAKILC